MYYKEFRGNKISALGLGSLRLPTVPGNAASIDRTGAMEVIDQAFIEGINFFDTAFTYHNTDSERFLGEATICPPSFMWEPGLIWTMSLRSSLRAAGQSILTFTCCTACRNSFSTTIWTRSGII